MPENGRKDELFVSDFVKEAEEQIGRGVKLSTQEEAAIKYGKGLWARIPAEGSTVVTKPALIGQDEAGKNIWQDVKTPVPNTELKVMAEAYNAREAQHRASARDELAALVKDTAAKVSISKPKARPRSKKGPELKAERGSGSCLVHKQVFSIRESFPNILTSIIRVI